MGPRRSAIITLTILLLGVMPAAIAQDISSVTTQAAVSGGLDTGGQVILTSAAPANGYFVELFSSSPVAEVPPNITVEGGQTSRSFTITTSPVGQNTPVTISAVANGKTKFAVLTVVPPVPTSLTFTTSSVTGGSGLNGELTLNHPSGVVHVPLSSSNVAAATVPAFVTTGSAFTENFTVTTFPVAQATTVTISASLGGVTRTAQVTVMPAAPSSLKLEPAFLLGGQPSTATVSLNAQTPPGGLTVNLSSSNTAVATVPESVNISAGGQRSFTVTTLPVAIPTTVTITASTGSGHRSGQLQVTIFGLSSFSLAPTSVTGTLPSTGQVSLTGPTPSSVDIQLASDNPTVATVPASVTIPANATAASFTITTFPVPALATETISATAGVTRTFPLTVLPGLSSVRVQPTSVVGGQTSTGSVPLTGFVSGGLTVNLSSSNTSAATVPSTVTASSTSFAKDFTITTFPVAQSTAVTITASAGGLTRTTQLNVAPVSLASVEAVTPIVGGKGSKGSVLIDGAATSNGFVVQLSSGNPAAVAIPPIVTIPGGATVAEFPIQTFPVDHSTSVTITAFGGPVIKTAQINVVHLEVSSVSLDPTVAGGRPLTGKVFLNASAPEPFAVNLSSNNTGVATVPALITVPSNAAQAAFAVTSVPVTGSTPVIITASGGGVDKSAQVNIVPPTLAGLVLPAVTGGNAPNAQVRLDGPAPAGGVAVNLSSSNTAVAAIAPSVTVEAGVMSAPLKIATVPVSQSTSVTITATSGGESATGRLNVQPPVPTAVMLAPTTTAGGTITTGQVSLSGPAPDGGFTVNLSSSNPGVAAVSPSVVVEARATTANFKVATSKVGLPTTVNISATAGGGSRAAVLTVIP